METATTEIIPRHDAETLISTREYYTNIQRGFDFAKVVCKLSGDIPEIAFAKMVYGSELGLSPCQSLRSVAMINGKGSVSTDCMIGLGRQVGARIIKIEHSTPPGLWCEVTGQRDGEPEYSFRWTIEMAKNAGLAGKDNWKNYPWDMLYARAASHVMRKLAPDRLANIYIPEEMESIPAEPKRTLFQAPEKQLEAPPEPDSSAERADMMLTLMEIIGDRSAAAEKFLRDKNVLKEGQSLHDLPDGHIRALLNGKRDAFLKAINEMEVAA